MATFKELHEKMLQNGYTAPAEFEAGIFVTTEKHVFSYALKLYGDCEAEQDYPAAYTVYLPLKEGKKQQETVFVVYSK